LPVSVGPQQSLVAVAPGGHATDVKEGVIEIEIGGARVVLRGRVDPASVRSVLMALRETA
jgi:transposase